MDRHRKRLYEIGAEIIAAVGHPIRLEILDFLRNGEQCVCDVAANVGAKRSNVSRHLAVLAKAGVVECRKDGLRALYRLKTPCALRFFNCATRVIREQARERNAILAKL